MLPTIATPCSSRSNRWTASDAAQHDDERAGNDGRDHLEPDDEDESGDADDEREPAGRAELAQQVPELLEEVALALLDAEELRQLPDHDRQGEADDESLHHRLGDEAREEAQAQEPRDQSRDPDGERHRDRELDEQVRVLAGEIADRSRRERRGRRHRPDDEVARAAESRVEEQRARRGVQPDDRRDACDRRVGECLGHEHRPDRQPRDDVAADPTSVVAPQPGVDRKLHRRRSWEAARAPASPRWDESPAGRRARARYHPGGTMRAAVG